MRCEELSDDLSAAADGSALLGRNERRHVERCLRCQAELVQYRKVLRAMRAMIRRCMSDTFASCTLCRGRSTYSPRTAPGY